MKKQKRICAITMARDDEFFLSRWIAYYGKQLGTENLYILLDGTDQNIPENIGNAHITKLPHEDMSRVAGDKYRIKKLSDLANELLKNYDIVIGCDVDEFLIVDPKIHIRPIETQISDLKSEIKKRAEKNERVLITTLTKRMAEDLTDFFLQDGIKVRYLHSDIKSIERVEILRDLRLGEFDVLIGVNLLREGLDIPEVSLVAIMDADKEGFLRSDTSLIQTIGRAARNACGEVIMYADKITDSMQRAIDETNRRREIQMAHNKKYGIIPQTIKKPIENNLLSLVESYRDFEDIVAEEMVDMGIDKKDLPKLITKLEKDMHKAAKILDFERAAQIRDQLKKLREMV